MRPLPRYDRGVSNVVLDWHRSEVRPWRNDKLELSVPLEPEPDSYWKDALQTYELQARRERAGDWRILRPGTDPYMHHVPDVYEALIVENIEPGQEQEIRETLEGVVAQLNEVAERSRQQAAEIRELAQGKAGDLQKAADEATKRFRLGS